MDDEIIHSWNFHDVECFDSTPSAAIIILDKDLESFFEPQIPAVNVAEMPITKSLLIPHRLQA